jgi:hypothetical protein
MWNSGNTMTNKQYHTPAPGGLSAQTFPKSNIKIVERDKIHETILKEPTEKNVIKHNDKAAIMMSKIMSCRFYN